MKNLSLYYLVLGATVPGKFTEQHDVIVGVASGINDLIPRIESHWNASEVHLDAWRKVTQLNGYSISVVERDIATQNDKNLFFVNLGGYKNGQFSEQHLQQLIVASDITEAIQIAKSDVFCREYSIDETTRCHTDNKFGIDVDTSTAVLEMLNSFDKEHYSIVITPSESNVQDELHVGYFPIESLR